MSCTKEEPTFKTKGEVNASVISDIINENNIKWIEVYEHNTLNGEWVLAASNQSYTSKSDLCNVQDIYFSLNGTGTLYYFNLEYLVSFELSLSKEDLYLYFKY